MLRVLGNFTDVVLEAYGSDDNDAFFNRYGVLTGQSVNEEAFVDRAGKKGGWKNQFRVYFNIDEDFVESLRKMGFNVMENKTPQSITDLHEDDKTVFKYIVSNSDMFWMMVEFGYRLGGNEPISWQQYETAKAAKV